MSDHSVKLVSDRPPERPTPPRSNIERTMRAIWVEVLGHRDFGIRDNFFAVGGDSFRALQMLEQVRARFGYVITFAGFLTAPTIAAMGLMLRGGASESRNALVPMQPTGDLPPLFCVHPMGGSVARYSALARELGPRQPVYGLQSIGLIEGVTPQTSVEHMAQTYVAEIVNVQPEPPHQLLGFSLGGVIAFEAAQQLLRRTGVAPLVALVDTSCDYTHEPEAAPYLALARFVLDVEVEAVEFRGMTREEVVADLHDRAVHRGTIGAAFPVDLLYRILDTVAANLGAAARYRPSQPLRGDLLLIRSEGGGEDSDDLGWGAYASRIHVHHVGLGHFIVMEPKGAARVAAVLRRYLAGHP